MQESTFNNTQCYSFTGGHLTTVDIFLVTAGYAKAFIHLEIRVLLLFLLLLFLLLLFLLLLFLLLFLLLLLFFFFFFF